MSLFYIALLCLLVVVLITITINKSRSTKKAIISDNKSEISDTDPNDLNDPDKYDLHESVYNFMYKQSQYIASLK